jgi:hypothetical protein
VLSELSHLEAELDVDDILLCRSLAELALDRRIASSTGVIGVHFFVCRHYTFQPLWWLLCRSLTGTRQEDWNQQWPGSLKLDYYSAHAALQRLSAAVLAWNGTVVSC